tara:strand:+ start:92 stop:343 length:252 start_codon:yes stop_codon:yes gene_type:complete
MRFLEEVESALRDYVEFVDMHIYSDSTADCMIADSTVRLDDVLDNIQDEFPEIEILVNDSGLGSNNMYFVDFQIYHDPQGILR